MKQYAVIVEVGTAFIEADSVKEEGKWLVFMERDNIVGKFPLDRIHGWYIKAESV